MSAKDEINKIDAYYQYSNSRGSGRLAVLDMVEVLLKEIDKLKPDSQEKPKASKEKT